MEFHLSLLGPDDPAPYSASNESGRAPLLLLCDHAGKAVPRALGDLGISVTELARHIGWDIGALDVARELSRRLDAPLLASSYSRLVIDCNRWPGGEGSIPEVSDLTPIPANHNLPAADAEARADACFWPYHRAVDMQIAAMLERGMPPALLVVHSFTPSMNGRDRPWELGVLWDQDPRLPVPLLDALRRHTHLTVGDNEPYSARASYEYTLRSHAVPHNLPHCSIEIRQDLIDTPAKALVWASLLAPAIAEAAAIATGTPEIALRI
jgi:predicted N-formylglutamate amidohydrolase